jgi:hypothetical protein
VWLRQQMNWAQYLALTLRETAKWAGILIIPTVCLILLVVSMSGGIEGDGKLIFLIAMAPMLWLEPLTKRSDGASAWVILLIAESLYFLAIVFFFRLFQFHRMSRSAARKIAKILRPKPPH